MEKFETNIDGVVNPSHPPIIGVVSLKASASSLKAGTILALEDDGSYSAASNESSAVAVLVEDVGSHPGQAVTARVLLHGLAVESRLLNATQDAPSDALTKKLSNVGIYLTQDGWDESNFS